MRKLYTMALAIALPIAMSAQVNNNYAEQQQGGDDNSASIEQVSSENYGLQVQDGKGGLGNDNTATLFQGTHNPLQGNNTSTQKQHGIDNFASVYNMEKQILLFNNKV